MGTRVTTANSASEGALLNLVEGNQANKRVYMTPPLTKDVRLSGTASADLAAALGLTQSNISVIVADYGQSTQVSRTNSEGVVAR